MKFFLPEAPTRVLWALERAGFPAYLVGGSLRDCLRGEEPHDWDVTTSALPDRMAAVFDARGMKTIPTGIRHGTITVVVGHVPVECTTYRVDGAYTDARHPDCVRFTDRISEDLARRDFTVNAMAYRVRQVAEMDEKDPALSAGLTVDDPTEAGLIDLFGGRDDLENRILRCVGDPQVRFREDALRILRGVRFCVGLGLTPDAATAAALASEREGLARISAERITRELTCMLIGAPSCSPGCRLMDEAALWQYVLPAIADDPTRTERYTAVDALPRDAGERLACLLCGVGEERAAQACRALHLSGALTGSVCRGARAITWDFPEDDGALRRRMASEGDGYEAGARLCAALDRTPGRAAWEDVLSRCEAIRRRGDALRIGDLAVNGRDVMERFGVRGADVGALLEWLLSEVLVAPEKNCAETLLALARTRLVSQRGDV